MYLKLTNGKPEIYSIGQFRRDNAPTAFAKNISNETLAEYGVYPYTRPDVGEYDSLAWVLKDDQFIQSEDGSWSRGYKLEPRAFDDAAARVRSRRNGLLAECDWTQINDAPVNQQAWAVYRQALRDITAQVDFPFNVTWPTAP